MSARRVTRSAFQACAALLFLASLYAMVDG